MPRNSGRMLRRWFAPKGSRRGGLPIIVIIIPLMLFIAFFTFEIRLKPIIREMSITRAKYIASRALNDAINEELERSQIVYDDLIDFEKDSNGQITALKTNMVQVNKIKTEITSNILNKINDIDSSELAIPLGNIISGELLSGRGPRINIRVVPLGSATAAFRNVFVSAGINQTRHQIIIEASVSIAILLPGQSATGEVSTEVSIAETILVGTVPNSYTYIEDVPLEKEEKIDITR